MPAPTPRAAREAVTALRLLPPDPTVLPAPLGPQADADQAEALAAAAAGRDVAVHGAPGSGRTRLALTAAIQAAAVRGTPPPGAGEESPERVWLLAPRRASATVLRDAVSAHGLSSRIRVATPAAVAFAIVRAEAVTAGRGLPMLITGADQDALIADIIASVEDWRVSLDPAARLLPGFRAEVRDVLARAGELGLGPADLEALAHERERPAWLDAAHLQQTYLDVLDLESRSALDAGERLDPGRMVRRAAQLVEAGLTPVPSLVVVDDAQDLTAAAVALVRALRRAGSQVLLTSCPDAVVDTFRGALPDALARVLAPLADPVLPGSGARPVAETVFLRSYRVPAEVRGGLDALRARLPLAGVPSRFRRPGGPLLPGGADAARPADGGGRGIAVLRAPGAVEEARRIATVLRDLHHAQDLPYDDMAVICRSGGIVDELADLLQRQGLPVTTAQRLRPLREEPVVADLLRIIELALSRAVPSPEEAEALLRGPYGEADALRLRRIRRRLLLDAADPSPSSAELLARALVDPEPPEREDDSRDRTALPLVRLRRMIAAVRRLGPVPAAEDALWAAWEAAGLAEGWRAASLQIDDLDEAGARGRLAGRRLDAVTALFASADRLTERRPAADALGFVEHVRSQAVAEDTLAPRGQVRGRVRVLTPAAIAGADADTVVLARVQEGAWPNTRLRSTLFGAAELALAAADPALPTEPAALRAVQRESVLADEIRLAVSAISRARTRVLITAVDDEDAIPSPLLDVIADAAGGSWLDPEAIAADPGPAPDARRLVAALRRRLAAPERDEAVRRGDAALLAELAQAEAPGADPARWYHQRASSTEPLLDPQAVVSLSPSALERAHTCPQSWLLERSGGTPGPGPAQSIGTIIHRIAQDHPAGSSERDPEGAPQDLLAELSALLAPLHLGRTWSTRRLLGRAEDTVALLAQHLEVTGLPLAVEAPFTVRRGDVELRGTIDRIEGDATGLRVVDLKTGAHPKSKADAALDLQLAAYQTAVAEGALAAELGPDAPERLGGAQLVYVGTGAKAPVIRTQGALSAAENPHWFDEIVSETARDVRASHVSARRSSHCDRCPVRRTCALWPEGAEL